MQTMKGQLGLRSSALSPTSSKITTQYLVLDHMNNHYRKIVSAKSAIDNKPPKALKSSQKVRDRKTRDYVKKTGSRPQSRVTLSRPHSQMQYYDENEDYADENEWGEYDPDDEEEQLVQNIMRTTLRPKSSSVNATHGSETEPTDRLYEYHANTTVQQHRPMSSKWTKTRNLMSAVRAVSAPISARGDKTYDGDIIQKRAHAFTEEKPFTPRTLKTKNRTSRLSEYKYYTPPPQKRSGKKLEEDTQVQETKKNEAPAPKPRPRQSAKSPQRVDASMTDTLMFESLQSRDFSRFEDKEGLVPKLDISLDKDHMNWLQEQASKAQLRAKSGTLRSSMSRIREDEMMDTTDFDQTKEKSTLGKTNTRSFGNTAQLNNSQRLHKEEEELKYMEFMKEVTDDVLNRGVFTNRVLKQVFESHIRKRKGELDERRMRSMIGKVRGDLGILDDDTDLGETNQMGETVSTSSFNLRPTLAKFEQSKVSDVTFGSTVDSQNTYKFKSTSSADMYSTIHSENEDLSGTQALKDYQLNITRKEELSEGEVTPEESESSQVGKMSEDGQRQIIQVSSKEDDDASVHSRLSKARSTGNASVHSHVSKAKMSDKESDKVPSSKPRSRTGSQRDDDTLTERSQNRTENDHTDDGEYGGDEFETESDGDF